MATITVAELRNRTLRHLKQLEAQEQASAEDASVVEAAYDTLFAELETLGLAYWTKTAIPEDVVRGLVWMLGADVAPDFVAIEEVAGYVSLREQGERLIRRVTAKPNYNMPIERNYF